MTNDEIKQCIIDRIPHTVEATGITNKYYVIPVSQTISLELSIIGDMKWHRHRILYHENDHHIDDLRVFCERIDFIDCLQLLDFLKND